MIEMVAKEFTKPTRAIVKFGPAEDAMGTRPATFYQVVIDPDMVSPAGDYIRFGAYPLDEITGWQKVDAMTVCEVLGEADPAERRDKPAVDREAGAKVSMRVVNG